MKIMLLFLCLSSALFLAQESEIRKVLFDQQNDWNNGDIEAFMQGYWKSDSLMFIGSKGPVYGWQTTLDNYKKSYPTKEKMGTLEFSDLQVKMLGKKYAAVFGRWKLFRKEDSPNGIFTLIFQKFSGGWKIIQDHTQ